MLLWGCREEFFRLATSAIYGRRRSSRDHGAKILAVRGFLFVLSVTLGAIAIAVGAIAAAGTPSQPVLGSTSFSAVPDAIGWGSYRPIEIFNGGDPSGMIRSIVWTDWGEQQSYGYGLGNVFRPLGRGYFKPLRVELRASDLGRCRPGGPLTYRHLDVREPTRPGSSFAAWFVWSDAKTLCKSPF
jgi:hypothetical protein